MFKPHKKTRRKFLFFRLFNNRCFNFHKKKSFRYGISAFATVAIIFLTIFSLILPQNSKIFAANGSWDFGNGANGTGDSNISTAASNIKLASTGASTYTYRKQITFDTTAQGASVTTNQTDFPVAVHINSSSWATAGERTNFFNDTYNPSGKRINFYDSDGTTRLAYEVEYYNTAAQEALYWVKVPQVNGNSATDKIIVGYGNDPSGTNQDQATTVWDSGFVAVYHLGDNGWTSGATALRDSTANANNSDSITGTTDVTGNSRQGRLFDGSDDKVRIAHSTSLNLGAAGTSATYEAWSKTAGNNGSWGDHLIGKAADTNDDPTPGNLVLTAANKYLFQALDSGTGSLSATGTTTVNDSTWRHVAGVRNNNSAYLYLNGAQEGTASGTLSDARNTAPMWLGNYTATYAAGELYKGDMDEVRISSSARSADWLKLTYYSLKKTAYNGDTGAGTSKLITFGSQQSNAYLSPGIWTSDAITATGIYGNWNQLTFTNTVPGGTTINYKVYQSNGSTLIPDGVLPGNSSGFTSSPVDLSGVSTTTYPTIILKATLTGGTATPTITALAVSYTYDTTAPSVPIALTIGTVTNNTIPLSWTASTDSESGIVGYEVQRASDSGGNPGTWANVASGPCSGVLAATACNDTTVSANTKYYYKVRAKDNVGNYSGYSGEMNSASGVAALWHLNEGSGAPTTDSSGNVNTGTVTIGATGTQTTTAQAWSNGATGRFGNSLNFDGTDDYISVPDSSSLQLATSLTVEAWFKTSSAGVTKGILRKDTETGTRYLYGMQIFSDNKFRVNYYNGTSFYIDSPGAVTDGQWHYGVMTIEGTTIKGYLDGAQIGDPVTITGTQGLPTGQLNIGANPPYNPGARGAFFNGQIDEVKISNVVRSASDIQNYYNEASLSPVSSTTLTGTPVLNSSTSPTTDTTPQITNSSTPDSSFASRNVKLYDNGVLAATTTANGSGVFTFANGDYSAPLSEGAHTNLTARALNSENVESADSNALSISVDSQVPVTSLSSNPASADGGNGYFKTIPTITLSVSDPAPSGGNGTTYYKWDDAGFTSPSTYTAPIDMDLSIGQGTHTLYWRTTDSAGNSETIQSQQFKLDSEMPNTLSVSISGGETYETLNPVSLTLGASDVTSGVYQMQFSNDGITYSTWEAFGTSKSWDLTNALYGGTADEGTKTVYVKFNDNAGNVTTAVSDSIVLDTVNPTNPSSPATGEASPSDPTPLTTGNWYNHTTPKFTLSGASDATSGIDGYWVYWGNSSSGSPTVDGSFQTGSTFNPTITSDNSGRTYYLRVRAKDEAGNLYTNADASVYTLFTYKFDVTNPNAVDYITPDPAGWSSTDSFDFSWPVATDVAANGASSGVQGYQYKKQPDAGWTSAGTNSIAAVTSYQNGVNVLQVRTLDNAGNYSSTVNVNYYYAGNVAAPTNLVADISQSEAQTVNNFKFTWDAPVGETPQGYYYSVNAVPNTQNSTYTTNPYTAYGAFATQQGLNTFYVVTKDENGNVGWSNYAQVSFSCNTTAPGIPTSIMITDSSSRDSERWQLTVNWDQPAEITNDFNGYVVERSVDGGAYIQIATTSSQTTGYLDTNLENTKQYSYRIRTRDNTGNVSSTSTVVAKTPTGRYTNPPSIIGSPSFEVKSTKAEVKWTTDRESDSFIQIGTTSEYGMTQGQLESVKSHKVVLSGLTPGTTYHFRAMWRDSDGNIGYSNDQVFRTTDAAAISEVKVSDINLSSAIISWKTNTISTSTVMYGKTSSYGSSVKDESNSGTTIHTVKLSNLDDGTNYNFKIGGSDTEGTAISSDNYVFQTLPKPRTFNVKYEQVKDAAIPTLKVTWDSNVPTSSVVEIYEGGSSVPKETSKAALEEKHSINITNLKDNTSYSMIVKGRDEFGNEAVSESVTLKTAVDTRPPVISNITVESSIIGFGEDAKGQIVVSWETDEMSSSQVIYGLGASGTEYSYRTQEDNSLTTQHIVIISDLKPSSSYHFSVISKDSAGNKSNSIDTAVLTEQATASVVDVVIKSLQNSIGWIFGALFGRGD